MPQGHGYLRRLTQSFDGAIIPQSTAKAPADEAGNASLWLDGEILCKLVGVHPTALKYRKFVDRPACPNPSVGRSMKWSGSDTVDLVVNVVSLPLSSPSRRSDLFEAIDAARASHAAGYAVQASKLFRRAAAYAPRAEKSDSCAPLRNVCSSGSLYGARSLAGRNNKTSSNSLSLLSLLGRSLLIYRCRRQTAK